MDGKFFKYLNQLCMWTADKFKPMIFIFPDFFGFHKISQLVVTSLADFDLPEMSLTTCLAVCAATTDDVTHVAIVLETRCICAKGLLFIYRLNIVWINNWIVINTSRTSNKVSILFILLSYTSCYNLSHCEAFSKSLTYLLQQR